MNNRENYENNECRQLKKNTNDYVKNKMNERNKKKKCNDNIKKCKNRSKNDNKNIIENNKNDLNKWILKVKIKKK